MVLIWGQNIRMIIKACATFIVFIAREQRDILLKTLEQFKFSAYKRMRVLMLAMKRLKCSLSCTLILFPPMERCALAIAFSPLGTSVVQQLKVF